jgi:hypothetical protein
MGGFYDAAKGRAGDIHSRCRILLIKAFEIGKA